MSTQRVFNAIRTGVYRHYKGGKYNITGFATHSETLETMVIYSDIKTNKAWVRPYKMFTDDVFYCGEKRPRFELITCTGVDKCNLFCSSDSEK